MQNALKFIDSAKSEELFKLEHAIKKRMDQIQEEEKLQRLESEQKERNQQWELWKERTLVLMEQFGEARIAVEEAYKSLSNLWIQRNGESTCPECGKECDDYYEFIFCSTIEACSECTDSVDLRLFFDDMQREIVQTKRIKC